LVIALIAEIGIALAKSHAPGREGLEVIFLMTMPVHDAQCILSISQQRERTAQALSA
jgi:hypothetical protein